MTTVVNILKDKYDVDGARSGKWGNIFFIGHDGSRAEVVRKHRWWLMEQLHLLLSPEALPREQFGGYSKYLEQYIMAKHEFITDPNVYRQWPGNIICLKCNETATARCDFMDSERVIKFRSEQNERNDCPGEENES